MENGKSKKENGIPYSNIPPLSAGQASFQLIEIFILA
jgi:hypothetical protein